MVKRRDILQALTRARLLDLARELEVSGLTGRAKADIARALARKRSIGTEALLGHLKRDELKSICRAVGLDDSGREKAVIIRRILGKDEAAQARPAASPAPRAKGGATKRKRGNMANTGRSGTTNDNGATLGFEATLWKAADKLRSNLEALGFDGGGAR